jgi:hypothetical protein
MALLSIQQVVITGTTPSYGAVAASDTLVPDDGAFLIVKNGNAGADSCVVVTPGTTFGQSNPDVTVSVPATTGERWIGPMVPELADPTTGLITITHSVTATVTCAYVRVA